MLGDFVVIYSTRASNMHVTILENSINCSDIVGDTETEPITTIAPKFYIEIWKICVFDNGSIITKFLMEK